MPAIPTPPKRSFRTPEAFRPAHWVSARTPARRPRRPEAAARGGTASPARGGETDDTADGELHRALEQVAPDLSGQQVVELLNLADEHGIGAGDDEALAELADWVRENRPDFATPLREELDSGELENYLADVP
ncbi:MAG: hypothetical protein TEF_02305 [Rhizobiales bacterium NRL2]|jgi:hypothetical protein|nr:MAG: hypothetical protein TEF_02305 [Rhizobiales bacterium NRL2]